MSWYQGMEPEDVVRVAAALPPTLAKAMHAHRGMAMVVAGGFVRDVVSGRRPRDVDVFVGTEDDVAAVDAVLRPAATGEPHVTDNATGYVVDGRLVQVVTRWTFTDAWEVLRGFDFTVAQAAVWHEAERWWGGVGPSFYADLAARRLRLSGVLPDERTPEEAGGTLMRLVKHSRRGYVATPDTVAACAWAAVAACEDLDGVLRTLRGIDPGYWPEWVREQAEREGAVQR